jgi:pimeloyl-ACP methyl ester carboxylesterase
LQAIVRISIDIDRGSGPAVVLLHGQPGNAQDWVDVVDLLPDGVRIVVPDRPGYGRTGGSALSIADNAREVLALMDELGIPSATVAAHSWAGAIALQLAENYTDRVDALALAASVGPGAVTALDRILATRYAGEALAWSGTRVVRRALGQTRARDLVARRFGARVPDAMRSSLDGAAWRSFVVEQRAMILELPGIVARLGDVRALTSVIAGDRDHIVPLNIASALAAGIPRSRLVVVHGVGHALPHEAPEVVANELAALASDGRAG